MQLAGIHHLTAISAKPRENLAFYTGLLGMRLVKKTVNQDDLSCKSWVIRLMRSRSHACAG